MTRRQIPNCITIGRLILLAPIFYCLVHKHFVLAFWLFVLAGASDGLDGYLARRFAWQSRFGRVADPTADKLLIFLTFIGLSWVGEIPWWLTGVVFLRDLVIVTGSLVYLRLVGPFQVTPSLISKINTVTQLGLLILVLLTNAYFAVPRWLIDIGVLLVLVTSILSGVDYVWVWWRRGMKELRKRRG